MLFFVANITLTIAELKSQWDWEFIRGGLASHTSFKLIESRSTKQSMRKLGYRMVNGHSRQVPQCRTRAVNPVCPLSGQDRLLNRPSPEAMLSAKLELC